ncbi:MAG: hypothetical protein IKY83_04430 [Proteobacteria bacterium]|nr:hypothetical protein [Pseudomonadota bacterium]
MTDKSSEHTAEFPPGFVYKPVIEPPETPKQRWRIRIISWTLAIACHACFFYIAGFLVDSYQAEFGIDMAWSNEPLSGFGMMDVEDWSDEGNDYEPPPKVESEDDPFEESFDDNAAPALDPDSIVIPEPEPEPEPEKDLPAYDLANDKQKLAAVKKDVATMPNLHVLAPGNAKLIVLIRNDRVAGSKFENSIRRLFRAFPDYRFALGASDIDPVNDIQAMLIATANPALYAETFLAVSHQIPEDKLKKYITESFPTKLDWKDHNARPLAVPDSNDGRYNPRSGIYKRALYLAAPNTVLFLRPEVLPTLDVAHVDSIVTARDKELADAGKAQTFLQSLGNISASDSDSMPTLFLMVQGIRDVRLGSSFPKFEPPVAMTGSMSTADRPHLNLDAVFATPDDAKSFTTLWPDILQAASKLGIPGLGALLNALSLTAEKEHVFITGDLNGTMIGLILMFAANHLESNS